MPHSDFDVHIPAASLIPRISSLSSRFPSCLLAASLSSSGFSSGEPPGGNSASSSPVTSSGTSLSPSTSTLSSSGSSAPPKDSQKTLEDFLAWFVSLPWKRVAVWGVVAVAGYQLKDFFSIAMGTFIIAFVGHSFVQVARDTPMLQGMDRQAQRRTLVVLFFLLIASVLTLFGVTTIPDLVREGADFVHRLQSDNIWVVVLDKMRAGLGHGIMDKLERFLLMAGSDDVTKSALTGMLTSMTTAEKTQHISQALQSMVSEYVSGAVALTSGLLTAVTKITVQVFISLVLSFMILWDLPIISQGVASLKTSRLADIYEEVAPSIVVFSQLFGKAMQAQARIAMVNTALTALGMWALAIPGMGLLSLFVFICSFIPIAGALLFISFYNICFFDLFLS
jgi:predicted PurR-regulated permease PerM